MAERGSTGSCEMSWFQGLSSGKIGQPPIVGAVPGAAGVPVVGPGLDGELGVGVADPVGLLPAVVLLPLLALLGPVPAPAWPLARVRTTMRRAVEQRCFAHSRISTT